MDEPLFDYNPTELALGNAYITSSHSSLDRSGQIVLIDKENGSIIKSSARAFISSQILRRDKGLNECIYDLQLFTLPPPTSTKDLKLQSIKFINMVGTTLVSQLCSFHNRLSPAGGAGVS